LRGAHAGELRHAQAVLDHSLLHDRLVAEADRRVGAHAGHAERLAHARREDHARLPQALDAVGPQAAAGGDDAADRVVLVEQAGHLQVVAEVTLHFFRQSVARRVADAVDLRADLGEAAREVFHLWRIVG
jgi:hypothetical protein